MKLTPKDISLLSHMAISAAYQAGQLISGYTGSILSVKNKKDNQQDKNSGEVGESLASQVVTEVDTLSQELILKALLPSFDSFDIGLLTEESTDNMSRLEKDYFWCIDPLDGTLPFIESKPGYSVSIALISRNGTPVIGVVYDPVEQTLYHAIKGEGAFQNKKPWSLPPLSAPSGKALSFIIDRSFLTHPDFDTVVDKLNSIASEMGLEKVEVANKGGAVMNACWVLENQPACYFKFPKSSTGGGSLWDYASTTCIYNELGAVAADIYGNPPDLNRSDSTFMNHRGMLYTTNKMLARKITELYKSIAT